MGGITTFDLSSTLPSGVAHGGIFGIASSGPALPVGMTLSAAGILSLGAAPAGQVAGVVFTYAEP